jgi:hypothetical protein
MRWRWIPAAWATRYRPRSTSPAAASRTRCWLRDSGGSSDDAKHLRLHVGGGPCSGNPAERRDSGARLRLGRRLPDAGRRQALHQGGGRGQRASGAAAAPGQRDQSPLHRLASGTATRPGNVTETWTVTGSGRRATCRCGCAIRLLGAPRRTPCSQL